MTPEDFKLEGPPTDRDQREAAISLIIDGNMAALAALAETMLAHHLERRPWDPQSYGFWWGVSTVARSFETGREMRARRERARREDAKFQREVDRALGKGRP